MKVMRHIITVTAAVLLLFGVPVLATGYPQRVISGADAVSSATMIIDRPSGAYVVMINRAKHPNEENLATWEKFFRGEEIDFLFEDISCVVADTDTAGLEMARSFQSRLPENQMKIRLEDVTLMMSKAGYGRFDVIVLSKEFYEAYRSDGDRGRKEETVMIEEEGV